MASKPLWTANGNVELDDHKIPWSVRIDHTKPARAKVVVTMGGETVAVFTAHRFQNHDLLESAQSVAKAVVSYFGAIAISKLETDDVDTFGL